MKKFLPLIAFLAFRAPAAAQDTTVEVARLSPELRAETTFLNPAFLLFAPKAPAKEPLPLLIFLHGGGGVGEDLDRIKGPPTGVVKGIARFGKGPCIVVAPQCSAPAGKGRGTWIPGDLNILLRHLKATLRVDEKRIYLTGISMGGYGSWAWGAHHPEHFAAIAPVVGGIGPGGPKDVTPDLDQWAAKLATVPVYAFAGARDAVVPAERSERMIAAIRKAGGKRARIKVYPEEGHGAGRRVYSSPEFYEWLFSQKRE